MCKPTCSLIFTFKILRDFSVFMMLYVHHHCVIPYSIFFVLKGNSCTHYQMLPISFTFCLCGYVNSGHFMQNNVMQCVAFFNVAFSS